MQAVAKTLEQSAKSCFSKVSHYGKYQSKVYSPRLYCQSQNNPKPDSSSPSSGLKMQHVHKPNTLEKYLLVWMKKYPSVSEVPKTVTQETMANVRNWARIKINIFACIATAVVCIAMVISGKRAAKRGESLQKMNLEWHKQMAEKDKQK